MIYLALYAFLIFALVPICFSERHRPYIPTMSYADALLALVLLPLCVVVVPTVLALEWLWEKARGEDEGFASSTCTDAPPTAIGRPWESYPGDTK